MKSHLLTNYKTLYKIKDMLLNKNDTTYYSRNIINKKIIDTNTISIVMTACNRSVQTYFTLKTIKESKHKNKSADISQIIHYLLYIKFLRKLITNIRI